MRSTPIQDRGLLRVDENECKGCGLCIESCPKKIIFLSDGLNHYGYLTATYTGAGCTRLRHLLSRLPRNLGAITVFRLRATPNKNVIPIKGSYAVRMRLMKGNEALMKSAILSGCRAFLRIYPITPASEIAEVAALYMLKAGGVAGRK